MTTATSPAVGLGDLARDRSVSNASKHHTEYQDRAEPRSAEAMDYIGNSNPLRQHYVEGHGNGYSEEYYSQAQQQQQPHYSSSNGYSHHSSTPPTSTPSHYPHGSAAGGTYLPPPIQTASFGNGMPGNVFISSSNMAITATIKLKASIIPKHTTHTTHHTLKSITSILCK
ncbi:hypothetical protein BGZ72_009141 [Mortierella alpina]|nr:hypothetical protein BGZ72_009141 [Mortierella alpina]